MKNDESKNFSYSVHMMFSATYFFDSKNGPQAIRVEQAAPQ